MTRETMIESFGAATGPVDRNGVAAMPRPPRLPFEGALYHVCTRGNHREGAFRDSADYPSVISHLLGSIERSEESAEVKALIERMTGQGVACGQ